MHEIERENAIFNRDQHGGSIAFLARVGMQVGKNKNLPAVFSSDTSNIIDIVQARTNHNRNVNRNCLAFDVKVLDQFHFLKVAIG